MLRNERRYCNSFQAEIQGKSDRRSVVAAALFSRAFCSAAACFVFICVYAASCAFRGIRCSLDDELASRLRFPQTRYSPCSPTSPARRPSVLTFGLLFPSLRSLDSRELIVGNRNARIAFTAQRSRSGPSPAFSDYATDLAVQLSDLIQVGAILKSLVHFLLIVSMVLHLLHPLKEHPTSTLPLLLLLPFESRLLSLTKSLRRISDLNEIKVTSTNLLPKFLPSLDMGLDELSMLDYV